MNNIEPKRLTPEELTRQFHDAYERLAPSFGYETRADTKQFDPTSKNGRLMIAVCDVVLRDLLAVLDAAKAELAEIRANRLADQPNGNWLDRWGSCRVCGGEIPHGHTNECDIFKMEQTEHKLRAQLTASQNQVRVLREALENQINAGSTGPIAALARQGSMHALAATATTEEGTTP